VRVILNSWVGDKFLNNNKCHICDKFATTIEVELSGYYNTWLVVCKSCLLNMSAEIDKAILESKVVIT
jgi:hypothetical protein